MRVLFVDDEPRVLLALERSLAIANLEWEMSFIEGGEAAVAALAAGAYDVVVTDMRMPRVDGAAVLVAARERDPGMIRIVLSGQSDEAAALRVTRLAHQFLAKPCDAKLLRAVIERTGAVLRNLTSPKLRAMVGSVDRLPSSMQIFQELSALLGRDDASTDKVADLVRKDPAIASKLLQFVNSAFFAQSREIADVRHAVIRLGMKTVKNLVLGIGVFDAMAKWTLPPSVSLDGMQRLAFTTAIIAGGTEPDRLQADSAYMAGLLCDVGELVLAATLPEGLAEAWRRADERGVPRSLVESDMLGASHAEIGACLLGLWGLPFGVVEAVAKHHAPDAYSPATSSLPSVVWIATCVASGEMPDAAVVAALGADDLLQRALRLKLPDHNS